MTTTSPPRPPFTEMPLPAEPAPEQTTVVNLPPELLERLTPRDDTFISQPIATIVAACIALIAATIALVGVSVQVRANRQEAQKDRRAAAARSRHDRQVDLSILEASRNADRAKARATERLNLVTATIEMMSLLDRDAWMIGNRVQTREPSPPGSEVVFGERMLALDVTRVRMDFAGMREQSVALHEYGKAVIRVANGEPEAHAESKVIQQRVLDSFRSALGQT